MSNEFDRFISLEIYTRSSHPQLLQGLDFWLQLGLIRETQVLSLCRNYLTCPLPEIESIEINNEPIVTVTQPEAVFVGEALASEETESRPHLLGQIWRAFLDELSIRWLLFLGIFLVVVSSGVLAATQWHNFPDSGQYLILWGYTLSFCGIGFWLSRLDNLQLTSQTLKNIAILLVPINFWAMSSFSLGFNFIEWLIIPVAAFSLTGITYLHYRSFSRSTRLWFVPIFLLLGYLHLGWQIPYLSTAAVYLGMLAIIATHHKLFKLENNYQIVNSLFLLATWILLLVRALFIARSLETFSLAIAAAGWLLATIYLARERYLNSIEPENSELNIEAVITNFLSKVLQPVGIVIIFYGWFLSVAGEYFWQTAAINLLAINFFDRRLRCYWRRRDLTAIFLIGLEAFFLGKELLPLSLRTEFMNWAIAISHQSYLPESIFSITLFPYVILFLVISAWLYRRDKQQLAIYSSYLTFGLGIILTILGTYNPTWRTLNLALSAITFGYVSYRIRSIIYLTHICLLLTLASSIDLIVPNLSSTAWGYILLCLTVGEWSVFLRRFTAKNNRYLKHWYRSTWHFGRILAILSYICLVVAVNDKIYTGVWLWSIVSIMLTVIAKYSRRDRQIFAANFSNITLFFLQLLTLWQPETRSLGLAVATVLVAVNTNYLPFKKPLIYFTHGLGLLTIISSIDWLFSPLSREIWGCLFLGLALAEWLILISDRTVISWRHSYWHYGLLLATLSYLCFCFPSNNSHWGYLWLLIPVMQTVVARYGKGKQKLWAAFAGCIALTLVQILTFARPETRMLGLVVAVGLMFVNTRCLRHLATTILHIGFILALIANLLWDYLTDADWLVAGVLTILSLNLVKYYLTGLGRIDRKTKQKYLQAADYWSLFILGIELLVLSNAYFDLALNYHSSVSTIARWQYAVSSLLISAAATLYYRQQPSKFAAYLGVWSIELLTASLITLAGGNGLAIATANIILGLLSLFWISFSTDDSRSRLFYIPVIYAIIGILWRLPYFTSTTGLLTLGASLTFMGISNYQNRENKSLGYLSLAGITLSIYELAIYQMSQANGDSLADAFTILALVSGGIAVTYRLFVWWKQDAFANFSYQEILLTAHLHWTIACILKLMAAIIAIDTGNSRLNFLSISVALGLGIYAIFQGRNIDRSNQDWWVYVGLGEVTATIIYSRLIIPQLSIFDRFWVIIACVIALIIYLIPWANLGWRETPWRNAALTLPLLTILITAPTVSSLSLLVAAVFYLYIAYRQSSLRWSYLSLGLINWAVMRLMWQENLEFIWFAIVISLSILYIAQVDPYFQSHCKQRHYLRLVGSGFTCLVALLLYQDTGIIPSIISILLVFAGLGLRIRAFLFVGTITLMLTIIYQLIILVFTYSFLKWIVGLIAGIVSIVIAANFESQRDRLNERWQNYLNRLQEWQ
jgi:hypothetical protein